MTTPRLPRRSARPRPFQRLFRLVDIPVAAAPFLHEAAIGSDHGGHEGMRELISLLEEDQPEETAETIDRVLRSRGELPARERPVPAIRDEGGPEGLKNFRAI